MKRHVLSVAHDVSVFAWTDLFVGYPVGAVGHYEGSTFLVKTDWRDRDRIGLTSPIVHDGVTLTWQARLPKYRYVLPQNARPALELRDSNRRL